MEIKISEQDGALFRGVKSWVSKSDEPRGSAGGQLVSSAEEEVLGVIDFDGVTLHIAEVGDDGNYIGRVVDSDTIELIYRESGAAASVYRVTLKRDGM